jgi:hypothetical protein
MKEARIRVLTNELDYSDYQDPEYDWSLSVYGDVKEIIPMDIPEPKEKYVTLSHYFDVNLDHDMVTGRSVTAILHFLNQTPMDWYSKKQATVETIRNLPTSGLDSGSSWLDGVNGILMQQEPDSLKQDYWNRSKGYCFPCQHLNHSHGASSYAFTVFYAAATALEMPVS